MHEESSVSGCSVETQGCLHCFQGEIQELFNFLCVRSEGSNNNTLRVKLQTDVSVRNAAKLTHLGFRRILLEVCTQGMLYILLLKPFLEIS